MTQARRRRSVADAFLTELLAGQLDAWRERTGRRECRVVDLGGGTGTFASVLADLGYLITVIDPSPDALASLQRRTEDRRRSADLTDPTSAQPIRGLQGDASELVGLLGPDAADVVICHRVLEVTDDPAEALRGMAQVLSPGGALSLLVAQRRSLVLSQALAGHIGLARQSWQEVARFDVEPLSRLVQDAGFAIRATNGIGSIAGYVAESTVESDGAVFADLLALEREVSQDQAFRALAPAIHLFGELPTD